MKTPARVRHSHSGRSSRGFVLLAVLLGLLVLGGLGIASVTLAVSDVRMARNVMAVAEARAMVEQDITQAFESLDVAVLSAMPIGSTLVGGEGAVRSTEVSRVGDDLFVIAASTDVPAGPYRGGGLLVRLAVPQIGLRRAVSAGGPVRWGSGTTFAAIDTEIDADCGPEGATPVPADIGPVAVAVQPWMDRVTVTLNAVSDPVTPGPKYLSRECHRADPRNWGDPTRSNAMCGRYLPVVRAPGDLTIDGGVGQGVLIVEGDLTVMGGAEFHGLVLVEGRLETVGSGLRLYGAVQVTDPDGEGSDLDGGSALTYSPCAVGRALLGLGRLERVSERSWIGLFR